jgi:hypothetical protein
MKFLDFIIAKVIKTFLFTVIGWVFFRADTLAKA